jgi:hypothetical protein
MHKTIYFFIKTVVILVVLFLQKQYITFNQQNYKTELTLQRQMAIKPMIVQTNIQNLMRKRLFSLKKI